MNIEGMGDNDLLQLWRNCMEAVRTSKSNADKARSLILQINEVWEARLKAAKVGSFKAETPEIGVLKAVAIMSACRG